MCHRSNVLASITLLVIAGCVIALDAPDPAPAEAGLVEELAIELRADTPVIRRGETPRFTAHLVNRSVRPTTVVLPGDGSSDGWRTPVVRWSPPLQLGGRCGNINALKAEEVITLGPGQRVPLGWLGRPTLAGAGAHKVSVELEHIPDLQWSGIPLGKHDPGAMQKIRLREGFRAVSNVVEVQVRE
jgi:hypothetical protein